MAKKKGLIYKGNFDIYNLRYLSLYNISISMSISINAHCLVKYTYTIYNSLPGKDPPTSTQFY